MRQVTCEICGGEFETRTANKKVCSPKCRNEYKNRYFRKTNARRREYFRDRKREIAEQAKRDAIIDPTEATNDPWLNLVYGVMLDAKENGDDEALNDWSKVALALGGIKLRSKR